MVQIVAIAPEEPSYEELKERNARLAERLWETRRSRERMISWMLAWAALFGMTGTLLVLTWSGVIVV